MKKLAFFTLGFTFIILLSTSINIDHTAIETNPVSAEVANKGTKFVYTILESNGEVNFWPAGSVAIEVGGSIEFTYVGEYLEWGFLKPFYDTIFRYADGTVNKTVLNQSSDTIAGNLILGIGWSFNPSIIADTDWAANDATAIAVANTDPLAQYSMNGTLDIWESGGVHVYNYTQNIANGDQKTYLEYFMTSGVLLRWNSTYLGYHLQASLNLEYELLDGNGAVSFWPYGDVLVETDGKLEFLYTGVADDWDGSQPFFNCTFINSTGGVNTSLDQISRGAIAMNIIQGIGGWNPGLITTNDWVAQRQAALSQANTPASDPFSMNGTLTIISRNGFEIFNYTQNPDNGNQKTFLVFDGVTGMLVYWMSSYANYHCEAISPNFSLNSIAPPNPEEPSEEEKPKEKKEEENTPFIPGYPLSFLGGAILIAVLVSSIKRRRL
jgi:hypothetical protein